MRAQVNSSTESCGYVVAQPVTDADEACDCVDLLVWDGLFRCRECGTVYGLVYGYNHFRPRRRWRARS
jgi:hypothetical protein